MFGLGFSEIVVILVVALVVFGPKRLPEVARSLGKSMGELRKALDEVKLEVGRLDTEPPLTPSEKKSRLDSLAPTESTQNSSEDASPVTVTYPQSFIEEQPIDAQNETQVPEGENKLTTNKTETQE